MSDHKYDTASLSEKEQCWLGHIREWRKSGQIGREYASANGIKTQQLFQWVGYFRRKGWQLGQDDTPAFQRVQVVEEPTEPTTLSDWPVIESPLTVKIHLPNGVIVELAGLINVESAGHLLRQAAHIV